MKSMIRLPHSDCLSDRSSSPLAARPSRPPVQPQYLDEPPANFPVVTGEAGPDDVGLFLAGKPVRRGAVLSRLQQTVEYQAHQREMGRIWRSQVGRRINLMESWSNAEVAPAIGSGGTVYYPFGGPDLLHVSAMFQQARTYALMGLEPVGEVPPLESTAAGRGAGRAGGFPPIGEDPDC